MSNWKRFSIPQHILYICQNTAPFSAAAIAKVLYYAMSQIARTLHVDFLMAKNGKLSTLKPTNCITVRSQVLGLHKHYYSALFWNIFSQGHFLLTKIKPFFSLCTWEKRRTFSLRGKIYTNQQKYSSFQGNSSKFVLCQGTSI